MASQERIQESFTKLLNTIEKVDDLELRIEIALALREFIEVQSDWTAQQVRLMTFQVKTAFDDLLKGE